MSVASRWWVALVPALLALPAQEPQAAEKVDRKAVAERIVGQCAGVREGDLVLVTGDVRDLDLVEALSLAAVRRGASPLQVVEREATGLRYFTEVSDRYDATRAAFLLKLVELPTVVLRVESVADPALFKDVPASRLAEVSRAFRPAGTTLLSRNVRQVNIGNGLHPTAATAKQLGLSQAELATIFWGALATDPQLIQANGAKVKAALAGARELRVSHPNGTDLRMVVEGRQPILSLGVITPEQAAAGGAAAILYLPAGEALLAPVPGSAEGTVVFDRVLTGAGTIEKLTWRFQGGRLVGFDARPSAAFSWWKETYQAAPEGKDNFGGIDIGLHPGVKGTARGPLLNYIPSGMVTLFIGDDQQAGGSVTSPFLAGGFLPGATVTVDGKALVEGGVLKVAGR